jgi:hypothetical protein
MRKRVNRKNADPSVAFAPHTLVRPDLHTSMRPIARAVAFALLAGIVPAWAGPTGEQVVAGQASVSRAGTNTLITQGTDRACDQLAYLRYRRHRVCTLRTAVGPPASR